MTDEEVRMATRADYHHMTGIRAEWFDRFVAWSLPASAAGPSNAKGSEQRPGTGRRP